MSYYQFRYNRPLEFVLRGQAIVRYPNPINVVPADTPDNKLVTGQLIGVVLPIGCAKTGVGNIMTPQVLIEVRM